MKNNYIWLFGENLGNTANNNSFYFWKYCVNIKDEIDKYYIMEKNDSNLRIYSSLSRYEKRWIVWRNSTKHFYLYFSADLFLVTLSYRDVRPEHLLFRNFNFITKTSVIYLQHGTIAMKKLGYEGYGYNNNFFRFVYYNPLIKESLKQVNHFKDYQLYYGKYHPRYVELLRRNDTYIHENGKKILWFLTWREYKAGELGLQKIILTLKYILSSEKLKRCLLGENTRLTICFHRNFDKTGIRNFLQQQHCDNIEFLWADEIDLMDQIVQNDVLITDYSSLGFDFSFLNKPVILFTPDIDEYSNTREFYCDINEIKENSIHNPNELIHVLVDKKYGINTFFTTRMPSDIDYEGIRKGKYLQEMYLDFAHMQKHKITFLGYNFYGIGGTVFATRALAEALLERGYMVELFSLIENHSPMNLPYGLNMKACYSTRKTITNYLKRILFKYQKHCYSYLNFDVNKNNLNPYSGYGLKRKLRTIRSETVISTRESLHLFLNDKISEHVKNKIYFFHCPVDIFDQIFPNCMEELKKRKLEKVIHVSQENRMALKEKYDYSEYYSEYILGNALDSSRITDLESVETVEKNDLYKGAYLLRISKERASDIDNLIGFGKYLKDNGIRDIKIDVFGQGDYLDTFYQIILNEDLEDYINYCGFTSDIKTVLYEHDALVDFSTKHSFGMPYIEGVLNGKPVFCMRNVGSSEVLGNYPDVFFESYEDLVEKIHSLPNFTIDELKNRYSEINAVYGREKIGKKFLEILNGED